MELLNQLTEREQQIFVSVSKTQLRLAKRRLRTNFVELLDEYFKLNDWGLLPERARKHLSKYEGKLVWSFCDDYSKGHYFILDDNNIVIPICCFEQ